MELPFCFRFPCWSTVAYFTASKWAIRHETLTFNDPARDNRPVAVDIAVRRDKEMQANAGMITLPVAILNHGNTVKFTEYSFLANVFAARGYLAISIQHDLPTDRADGDESRRTLCRPSAAVFSAALPTSSFAVEEMKKVQPNADYDQSDHGRTFRWAATSRCISPRCIPTRSRRS